MRRFRLNPELDTEIDDAATAGVTTGRVRRASGRRLDAPALAMPCIRPRGGPGRAGMRMRDPPENASGSGDGCWHSFALQGIHLRSKAELGACSSRRTDPYPSSVPWNARQLDRM